MNQLLLEQIIEQADELTIDEQLQLIERLAHKAQKRQYRATRRHWRDLRGIGTYPFLGEDAQAWVSRIRQEGSGEREALWSQE